MKSLRRQGPASSNGSSAPERGSPRPSGRGNSFRQERMGGGAGSEASGPEQGNAQADLHALLSTPASPLMRRAELESRLGADLGGVRLHTGPEANGIVRGMGVHGVTFGEHIAFSEEEPTEEVLLHELSHVLQQRGGATSGIAADEQGARAAEQGAPAARAGQAQGGGSKGPAVPRMTGAKAEMRFKLPTNAVDKAKLDGLGDDKVSGGATATLDAKKAQAAIDYNNKKWTGPKRAQLRRFLGAAPPAEGAFTEAEVGEAQRLQLGAGVEAAKADGMIGDTSMAILLQSGFSFDLSGEGNINPSDVTLVFYPGEFEDLAAWTSEVEAAKKKDPESPYRQMNMPEGTGRLYIKHKGALVSVMNARGGPAITLKDGTHSADPTQEGSWKLGQGHAHVTNAWSMSQIAWGAPVRRRTDGEWEYQNSAKAWIVATGTGSKLKTPLSADDFEGYNKGRSTWMVNDFGVESWRIEGSAGQLFHTSPVDEEAVLAGRTPELTTSHGCVHLNPAERAEMSKLGYLQGGVNLIVKAYDQHLLPEEMRNLMEVGTAKPPAKP